MNAARAIRVLAAESFDGDTDDHIVLDFDHRHRRRLMMTSASGRHFLLDLESAVALRHGDVLALSDGSHITVRAKPEDVAEVTTDDPKLLTRIAWHLGNRHLPTEILGDRLRIASDHVIVEMIVNLGGRVRILQAPFQPEGGAYSDHHEH